MIDGVAEHILHALGDTRQSGELHHGSRASDGVSTAIGFLDDIEVAWALLETIQVGVDLRQIAGDFVEKTLENSEFIEVI